MGPQAADGRRISRHGQGEKSYESARRGSEDPPRERPGGCRAHHGARRGPPPPRPRRHHDPQGQHLLALPVPGGQYHPLAARGHDPEAPRRRLHRPGLRPEQHRRHRPQEGRAAQPLPAGARQVRRAGALQLLRGRPQVGPVPAQGQDAGAAEDLSRGHHHPRVLPGQEHRPPADGQVPHLHHDHRRDEERLRRPAQHPPPLHALVHPRDPGRPADASRRRSTPASSRSRTARPAATAPARAP